MKIVICLKAVRGDYVSGDAKEQSDYIMNPYDLFALQTVLEKRDKDRMQLVCLSMGGENIRDVLVKSIALGADDALWLCDKAFAGADTVATSYALAEGIKKISDYDLIICGGKAVDGETGQVGIGIGERLGISCIMNVEDIISLDEQSVTVKCGGEKEEKLVKVNYKAVLVFNKFTTTARNISLPALKKAQRKSINTWNADIMGIDKEKCGVKGSKTKVLEVVSNLTRKSGKLVEGDTLSQVRFLNELLGRGCVQEND